MKKSFLMLLLLCFVFMRAQQTDVLEKFRGAEFSQKYGVLSQLNAFPQLQNSSLEKKPLWQSPAVKQNHATSNALQTNMEPDYGFNTTLSEGVNIPFNSITDSDGNTYITGGSSSGTEAQGNFVTIKVDPNGNAAWQKRKAGTLYAVEFGMVITLAPDGNPIASGIHWNGKDMDIHTVKYDAENGGILWEANFAGVSNGLDVPTAVTIDEAGNVIIAGISYSGDSMRYVVLKYDTAGALLWSVTDDNEVESVWNEPTAIAVSPGGKIAVTGGGVTADYWQNYYTIAYSEQGSELWKASYTAQVPIDPEDPESELGDTNAIANDVAFDSDENVYVTGTFHTAWGSIGTVKYNAEGEEQWVKTYKSDAERTTGENIRIAGNAVYVGGGHLGDYSDDGLVLISYNENGEENWVQETDELIEPQNTQLWLDGEGQPVISGTGFKQESSDRRFEMVKYDQFGDVLLMADHIKPYSEFEGFQKLVGTGFDSDENIYLSLGYSYSAKGQVFETVKLPFDEGTLSQDWNNIYSSDALTNKRMLASVGDNDNNAYVTGIFGTFEDNVYTNNYFATKYNAQGEIAWEKVYNQQNGNESNGIQLTTTKSGDVVVYLIPEGIGAVPIKLIKYNPDGTLAWEFEKEVIDAEMYAFFTDNDGNVIVAGTSRENEGDENLAFTVLKVAADGTEAWTDFTFTNNEGDNIYSLSSGKADDEGNVLLVGGSGNGDMMSQEINTTVLKYSAAGNLEWLKTVVIPGNNSSASDLLIEDNGDIYINGVAQDMENYKEKLLLVKMDADGNQLWDSEYQEENRDIRSYTVKKLSTGEVVVSAFSVIYGYNNKVIAVAFGADGNEIWAKETPLERFYRDMYIDAADNVYILNQIYTTSLPKRIYYSSGAYYIGEILKIDAAGTETVELFEGPELSAFNPAGLVALPNGTLLIPGTLENENYMFQGLYFFQTTQETLGVNQPGAGSQAKDWLGQNYPNPAKSATQIPFYLLQGGNAKITLYDNTGKYVRELAEGTFQQGNNTVSADLFGLQRGIYFYRISSRGFTSTRKMIIK